VKEIAESLRGCNLSRKAFLGASVASIGTDFDEGCNALASFSVATDNTVFASYSGMLFNSSLTVLYRVPAGYSGVVTLPSSVTAIDECAFAHCGGVTDGR
jgi:hypothetical protein